MEGDGGSLGGEGAQLVVVSPQGEVRLGAIVQLGVGGLEAVRRPARGVSADKQSRTRFKNTHL